MRLCIAVAKLFLHVKNISVLKWSLCAGFFSGFYLSAFEIHFLLMGEDAFFSGIFSLFSVKPDEMPHRRHLSTFFCILVNICCVKYNFSNEPKYSHFSRLRKFYAIFFSLKAFVMIFLRKPSYCSLNGNYGYYEKCPPVIV